MKAESSQSVHQKLPIRKQLMRKKADLAMEQIVFIVILLIAALVIIAIFTGHIRKEKKATDGLIEGIGDDCDGDGVKDLVDPCPESTDNKPIDGICLREPCKNAKVA